LKYYGTKFRKSSRKFRIFFFFYLFVGEGSRNFSFNIVYYNATFVRSDEKSKILTDR